MFPRHLLTLALLTFSIHLVVADFYPLSPNTTTTWRAGRRQTITWSDDGESPSLKALKTVSIQLWTGSDKEQTMLKVLGETDADDGELSVTIDPEDGESGEFYFLRFRGDGRAPTSDIFSARFTISQMKGTFSATVKAQLADLAGGGGNSTSLRNGGATAAASASGSGGLNGTASVVSVSGVPRASASPSAGSSPTSSGGRLVPVSTLASVFCFFFFALATVSL